MPTADDRMRAVVGELKGIHLRIHGIGCLLQNVADDGATECWFGVGAILKDLCERLDLVRRKIEDEGPNEASTA